MSTRTAVAPQVSEVSRTAAPEPTGRPRLAALDVLRGLAVAGMVAVNAPPGNGGRHPAALVHAEWDGFTGADLVFPAFLCAVGLALGWADPPADTRRRLLRIARRTVVLVAVGIALGLLREPSLAEVRLPGVLQRIALASAVAAVVVLLLPRWAELPVAVALLVAGTYVLLAVPAPGGVVGDLTREGTVAGAVDRAVFGVRRLYYDGPFDPEGLLGVLPSAAQVLLACAVGRQLRARGAGAVAVVWLAVLGGALVLAGQAGDSVVPINKQLWTATFVLVSTGWSLVALAGCVLVVEVLRLRWVGWPAQVLGENALVVYALSVVIIHLAYVQLPSGAGRTASTADRVFGLVTPQLSPVGGSTVVVATILALLFVVALGLRLTGIRVRA